MADQNHVKIVTTIEGGYRNRGISQNVRTMEEATRFFRELEGCNLGNIKAIRVVPMAIDFVDPSEAARVVAGSRSSNIW